MDTSKKPTIEGRRVLLRPITLDDADQMYEAVCEPVTRWFTGTQQEFSRDQIARWCEKIAVAEDRVDLAIVSRDGGRMVGEVVLNDIDTRNLHASFRISLSAPAHFGKGYGSEASSLMLDYAFGELNLNRVSLEVYSFNPRAQHVYEKLGFREEGRLREVLLQDGEFHDAVVMGLLKREWQAASTALD